MNFYKPKLIRVTTVPISLEKLLTDQLKFMAKDFEVIAVSSDKKKLEKIGEKEGVRTYALHMTRKVTPVRDLIAVIKLFFYLRKEKPMIVHTHTPKAGIVGMMAAYFAGVPIRMHTVAGLPLLETDGFKRKMLEIVEKWTYRFATNIYPNSNGLLKIILNAGYTKESKLKVLGNGSSNGIDLNYFSNSIFSKDKVDLKRKELQIPSNNFVFVYAGRIVADKGINELVAAFIKLNERFSNTTLLLVGDYEQELDPVSAETMDNINKDPKIITTGYQDDVRIFYALSESLVFPSYREGFPNAVLQAGAMGLPAIVSNINGCNEIIIDQENGLIIPAKDENKLFYAMERVMTDQMLFEKMKNNARTMIASRFDKNEIWEALLTEYQSLQNNI